MNLKEYLIEALMVEAEVKGGYKIPSNDTDVVWDRISTKQITTQETSFKDFLQQIVDEFGDNNPFTLNNDENVEYFKLHYDALGMIGVTDGDFTPKINNIKYENILFKHLHDQKYNIYIKGDNGKWIHVGETGKGSVGKVGELEQETMTANVFNNDVTINNNTVYFKQTGTEKVYPSAWCRAWENQTKTIGDFFTGITTIKIGNEQYTNMFADKYPTIGSSNPKMKLEQYNTTNSEVAQTYREFHKTIGKALGRSKRDTFDPSDVFVYDPTQSNDIITTFRSVIDYPKNNSDLPTNEINGMVLSMAKSAIQQLIASGSFIGISLKKGNEFKYKLLNINDDFINDFSDINLISVGKSTKGLRILLNCKTFDNNNDKVIILVRTSGGKHIRILPIHDKHSQMGDVPKDLYRDDFDNDDIINDLHNLLNGTGDGFWNPSWNQNERTMFEDIIDGIPNNINTMSVADKEIYCVLYDIIRGGKTRLQEFILSGKKIGDRCLPYLLIEPKN